MTAPAERLTALDVVRGLSIAGMIVVNNPGNWNAVFPPLAHAAWHGCTAADLIFPFFIFIMGVAMPLAFARRRGDRRAALGIGQRIATRAALLVVLGLVLNAVGAWPHLADLRWPGVLQRIGVTYALAAWIVLWLPPRRQLVVIAVLLLGHWALLTLVPFGGYPAGTLTPTANLASHIDLTVFGRHTLTPTGDPEGLLGLAPAVATALLGAAAGWWLQQAVDARARRRGLLVGGAIAVVVGLAWSLAWPLNKNLWTGSYALFAAGLGAIALAVCDRVGEHGPISRLMRPFVWLGSHPLSIYVASEFVARLLERPLPPDGNGRLSAKDALFWEWLVPHVGDHGSAWSSAIYGIAYTIVWIAVAALQSNSKVRIQKSERARP